MKRWKIITALMMLLCIIVLGCNNKLENGANRENMKSRNEKSNISSVELATPEKPLTSPSGKYQLEVLEGNNGIVNFNRFNISKVSTDGRDPEVIFCSKDTFRTRDRLYFLWDDADRVWVYSGDIGTFYWVRIDDNNWQKYSGSSNKEIKMPDKLEKLIIGQ